MYKSTKHIFGPKKISQSGRKVLHGTVPGSSPVQFSRGGGSPVPCQLSFPISPKVWDLATIQKVWSPPTIPQHNLSLVLVTKILWKAQIVYFYFYNPFECTDIALCLLWELLIYLQQKGSMHFFLQYVSRK